MSCHWTILHDANLNSPSLIAFLIVPSPSPRQQGNLPCQLRQQAAELTSDPLMPPGDAAYLVGVMPYAADGEVQEVADWLSAELV